MTMPCGHASIAALMNILARCLYLGATASSLALAETPAIKHSFLATGGETRIVDDEGKTVWKYPGSTRDGCVLPNGNVLLAVSKNKTDYPGGAVVEITRDMKKVFEYKGTQSEVNTAQLLPNGNFMLTEAGEKPRILEVNREGRIMVEVPLQAQITNTHMQSRMSRKLDNGHYLVPQLNDRVVREYAADGKIAWEYKTPAEMKDALPFTVVRLPNGNTLATLTHNDSVVEVDRAGRMVWQFSNADLTEKLIADACGAQRLPNGNTVICSYHIGANHTKLIEVTPDKKVVWTFIEEKGPGIHEVQILDTNGEPVAGVPLR
ncbi:MAG: hypothetical protein JWO94_2553 [Verrucomicrobiaceae bacterium]|nr:hypothetical protein [Verrucomicrobiaceae bacterium]